MAAKRKRTGGQSSSTSTPIKRQKLDGPRPSTDCQLHHPVLSLYYPKVLSLRSYILSQHAVLSKASRRRVSSLGVERLTFAGIHHQTRDVTHVENRDFQSATLLESDEQKLIDLLDETLVGVSNPEVAGTGDARFKAFEAYSQQCQSTIASSFGEGIISQSDLIDLSIGFLFNRISRGSSKPLHMLCHGYQRAAPARKPIDDTCATAGILGLVSDYPNPHVATIKSAPWPGLLRLMGKGGEKVMLDLVLACGVFMVVKTGRDNFFQLSGVPLPEMSALEKHGLGSSPRISPLPKTVVKPSKAANVRSSTAITFVRSRMMHARAALNARGGVHYGFRHIHVLNRCTTNNDPEHTTQIMKYIFPRQFNLHNAFTSAVDRRETTHPFKDYTLREQEIAQSMKSRQHKAKSGYHLSLPKRLRGLPMLLVQRLQKLHSRCAYLELLKHYCPVDSIDKPTRRKVGTRTQLSSSSKSSTNWAAIPSTVEGVEVGDKDLIEGASPCAQVSAFCRAIISRVIPSEFWGIGEEGEHNKSVIMNNIDQFVRSGRFENLTLQSVYQRMKICNISWLRPPQIKQTSRTSQSDIQKRREIFLEFLYYVFDSMLIPLIRSNFHVTESNSHRNRLFFFRHDVWRAITETSLTSIKLSMFEELQTEKTKQLLNARNFGFSQIRLLPKAKSVRPIMNLRQRVTNQYNGKTVLGRSINSVLAPVFNILSYEKHKQPARLGSALFSVGDLYPRLKAFRAQLQQRNAGHDAIYFAKVDVQSCFDTIPQRRVVRLMKQLCSESGYRIARHAEIKSCETRAWPVQGVSIGKPMRKFIAKAKGRDDFTSFTENLHKDLVTTKSTIFVDSVVESFQSTKNLMCLLQGHVEQNIVKIGKKYYRQKRGIPQGSVLSTLLCNFFYADFEQKHLNFLNATESLLLRLVDDFLVVTTNKQHALRFLQVLHDGNQEYGIHVKPEKSLTNFNATVNDVKIALSGRSSTFPYCGIVIDTKTLEIGKDRERRINTVLLDSLTVERFKAPGIAFHRKTMSAFKLQTQAMFTDTSFNSIELVLSTLYENFMESAMKFYRYAKSMGRRKLPGNTLLIRTIRDLIDLSFVLLKSRLKTQHALGYECDVQKVQLRWLASTAFRQVLGMKQSKYAVVIAWLDNAIASSRPHHWKAARRLIGIARTGTRTFHGYRY